MDIQKLIEILQKIQVRDSWTDLVGRQEPLAYRAFDFWVVYSK